MLQNISKRTFGGSMKKEQETSGARSGAIAAVLLISIGVVGTATAVIATVNRRDHDEQPSDNSENADMLFV
jgi:flagellar basal body-associated protein FliL